MTDVSNSNKKIARAAGVSFGGDFQVKRFWDEAEESFVDILTCADRPQDGVISYATIGLSDWPVTQGGEELSHRIELVGACGGSFANFDNILSTAAFCVINSKWDCYPGAIFPDIVAMYDASTTMRHLFFVPPFLWEGKFTTLKLADKTVAWLLAIPISDSESEYATSHGSDALEQKFADKQIDVFDLARPPVV